MAYVKATKSEKVKSAKQNAIVRQSLAETERPQLQPSEGSRPHDENIMVTLTGAKNLQEYAPAATEHLFAANPILDNRIKDDSPEMIRRKNSHARDRRTGFKVTNNTVYAIPDVD